MFIDMFHIQMQLMQRLDLWNEYVCMYLCDGMFDILVLYGMWSVNKFVFNLIVDRHCKLLKKNSASSI